MRLGRWRRGPVTRQRPARRWVAERWPTAGNGNRRGGRCGAALRDGETDEGGTRSEMEPGNTGVGRRGGGRRGRGVLDDGPGDGSLQGEADAGSPASATRRRGLGGSTRRPRGRGEEQARAAPSLRRFGGGGPARWLREAAEARGEEGTQAAGERGEAEGGRGEKRGGAGRAGSGSRGGVSGR